MKKRLLSLALALALSMGLALPAFAAGSTASEQMSTAILTHTIGNHSFESFDGIDVAYSWKLSYTDFEDPDKTIVEDYAGYCAVRQDTVFTVTNTAPASENNFIRVYVSTYERNGANVYWDEQYPHSAYLTRSGTFLNDVVRPDDYGGLVELKPGESFQFKLPMMCDLGEYNWETGERDLIPRPDADVIHKVELRKWDMDNVQNVTDEWGNTYEEASTYSKWIMFKVDNAAVDNYLAGQNPPKPAEPTQQPAIRPTEADSFPYSIPGTSEFLRFSTNPVAKYQTIVPDFDANDNLYDKEVTVYQFEVGTKLGLTRQSIASGYTISNLSSEDFVGSMDQVGFILDKAMMFEQLYMVRSMENLSFFVYIQPVNTNTSFVDVKPGDYFEEAVKWAVRYGITNGTSTTTFSPGQTCTIAEILTFLYRAIGEPGSSISNPYTNVKPSDYYYEAALWAAEKGMIDSFTFPAGTPCSRANAVTFIWQAMGSPPPAAAARFADVDENADYAQAVSWAVGAGVTNGTSATTFSPNDTCTRGQIVTFLYRALE